MARPRVFVSSTFYDLRQVRSELAQFIQQMGYEPVLNERGHIPYDHSQPLEQSCYDEISKVDMLVAIVGGRFGTQSSSDARSISQLEVKAALEQRRPVYMFVEKGVLAEHRTFTSNKDAVDSEGQSLLSILKWHHADNIKVFHFLEEMFALPKNNSIFGFELASEITTVLREQWAGLLHNLLVRESQKHSIDLIGKLEATLATASDLAKLLQQNAHITSADVVDRVLMTNHPAFEALRRMMNVSYPTVFKTKNELESRLKAWGFQQDFYPAADGALSYTRPTKKGSYVVHVDLDLFDEGGELRYFSPTDWSDDKLRKTFVSADDGEDFPF